GLHVALLVLSQALILGHTTILESEKVQDIYNVTLTCVFEQGLFYWFKLNFGYMIQTVTTGTLQTKGTLVTVSPNGQFNNSRFSATKVGDVLSLTIRNVSKEDEATYFCQAGSSENISFINGTIVAVNDPKTQQKSITVKQTPDVESVNLSEPKTLQCSRLSPNEDKVHWFKGAAESHPGIIYHGSLRNKEDGRCDYSLSKTITNSPDAGMDYCALVTCGEILFGKRTKVEIVVTVLGALLTCSVLVNFAMFTRLILSGENQCKGNLYIHRYIYIYTNEL
uniref:Immunoglobulin domain-containing protein n=1 Tax=Neolamprologus brichardi TaxID=32507 RepID=A0A3Q4MSA1_NEOBR